MRAARSLHAVHAALVAAGVAAPLPTGATLRLLIGESFGQRLPAPVRRKAARMLPECIGAQPCTLIVEAKP